MNWSYRLEIEAEADEAQETGRIEEVAEETEVLSSSSQCSVRYWLKRYDWSIIQSEERDIHT